MSTPSERVQRLREETAKAVTGDVIDGSRWFLDTIHPQSAVLEVVAEDEGSVIASDVRRGPGAHIARWDPKAAEKVLDLVEDVLKRHREGEGCSDYRAALAVLDALDPLSDPSEEGK